ncbi:zinc finger, CCHC-type containing protein [Tanacetum coccineum]|uniref:Zinc finger, CCHC-type containing protein n=1 Tax=Tanacetum coccineum TaxID=301880 RepID=A0ABQ4ZUT4_9ASTR
MLCPVSLKGRPIVVLGLRGGLLGSNPILHRSLGDGIFAVDGDKWRHQRKLEKLKFSTKVLRDVSTAIFKSSTVKLADTISSLAAAEKTIDLQVGLGFDLDTLLGFNEEINQFMKAMDDSNESRSRGQIYGNFCTFLLGGFKSSMLVASNAINARRLPLALLVYMLVRPSMTTSVKKNSVLRSFFKKQKLTIPNFIDWYRQLRIILSAEDKENYLEHPIPDALVTALGQQVHPQALAAHATWVKGLKEIDALMLMTMELDIQQNLTHLGAYDMLQELKTMFAKQAEQELLQTVREFHACKQEEGQSVSSYVLKMKSYIENFEHLTQPVSLRLATVNELHAMLKLHEKMLPKKDATDALHAIRAAGGNSRVDEMILARVSSGFAGKKYGRTSPSCIWVCWAGKIAFWQLKLLENITYAPSITLENSIYNSSSKWSLEDLDIIQEEDTQPSIDTSLHHDEDDQEIDEPQIDINPIRELHWTTVKNIMKCLCNNKDMFLVYEGDMKRELRVSCYTDVGYLTDADDLKSQTGYAFVLNGALSETLRLYPAVPLDGNSAEKDDVLPDGFKIKKGDGVAYMAYPMGRMTFIWGEDAGDFRPERWLDNGVFHPESPFKFTAFQGGPRICLGKEFAYRQMKILAAFLVYFFKFKLVDESFEAMYRTMFTLHMDKGLHLYAYPR